MPGMISSEFLFVPRAVPLWFLPTLRAAHQALRGVCMTLINQRPHNLKRHRFARLF